MERKALLFWMVIVLLLGVTCSLLFYSFYVIKDVFNYPLDALISSQEAGFNLDQDKIHFGIVPFLGVSSRKFSVANHWNKETIASLNIEGELAKAIIIQVSGADSGTEETFYGGTNLQLKPGETKEVELKFIPKLMGKTNGFYEGQLRVLVKRAHWN